MEENNGYQFFSIDPAFTENEFLYDSKSIIIRFDIPMTVDLTYIPKEFHEFLGDFNKGQALFKNEKQLFFYFKSEKYYCEFYSENYQIVLKVNDSEVVLDYEDFKDEKNGTGGISCGIIGNNFTGLYVAAGIYSNNIELSVFSDAYQTVEKTPLTSGIEFVTKKIPGNFILDPYTRKIITKKSVLRKTMYDSIEELKNNVHNIISSLNNLLYLFGGHKAFWNRVKVDDAGKTELEPKIEIDSQDAIILIIADKIIEAGLSLHKEESSPAGNVDFYINGCVKNIGMYGICLEIKNVHSQDLEDGFIKQLPEYVKRKNAIYGIYLILYFNSNRYDIYKDYNNFHEPADNLNFLRTTNTYKYSHENIFAYSLDVSKPIQASKK